jgi:hypothetical protein
MQLKIYLVSLSLIVSSFKLQTQRFEWVIRLFENYPKSSPG